MTEKKMKTTIIKKQLTIAVVLLFVALLAVGGATYAWFSLNSSVRAEGIQISAYTEGTNFEIAAGTVDGFIDHDTGKIIIDSDGNPITDVSLLPDDYKSGGTKTADPATVPNFISGQISANISLSSAELYPVHPVVESLPDYAIDTPAKWYHAYSDSSDSAKTDAEQTLLSSIAKNSNVMSVASGPGQGSYALVGTFYVRLNPIRSDVSVKITGVSIANLVVSGEGASEDLASCIRVLAAGSQNADIIAAGELGDEEIITEILPDGSYYTVDVYAFFEGTDEDCKSSNYTAKSMGISVDIVGTLSED